MTEKKSELELAAAICGCEVGEVISYRLMSNGFISIIAPTGQKFVYSAEQLEEKRAELAPKPKPKRKAPTRRRTRTSKKVNGK
jgi:hypothetical protein